MNETDLRIELAIKDDDPEQLDRLTSRLRRELLQLDVKAVTRPSEGEAPSGSRGVDVTALGALIVQLAQTPELLASVIKAVHAWLGGRTDRFVRIEMGGDVLQVTGVSSAQQQQLIESWIKRHTKG